MTVRPDDRAGPEPDDDADDETWWDRHGSDAPAVAVSCHPGAAPGGQARPDVDATADRFGWSTLLLSVAVVGGLVTLPVLGFTGGPGRVLTPTLWALIGTAVGVRLSHREPRWDLGDPRRVEVLLVWVVAYAIGALVGLRFFEGDAAWWLPATVLTVLAPFATARSRRVLAWARLHVRRRATPAAPDLPA